MTRFDTTNTNQDYLCLTSVYRLLDPKVLGRQVVNSQQGGRGSWESPDIQRVNGISHWPFLFGKWVYGYGASLLTVFVF